MPSDPLEPFEQRDRDTNAEIRHLIGRWQPPSPFTSFAEYERALARAYSARAAYYRAVFNAVLGDQSVSPVVRSALTDGMLFCEDEARECERAARLSELRDVATPGGAP